MTSKCKNKSCGEAFTPSRPLQVACSVGCAIILSKDKTRADLDRAAKIERAETKKKLGMLKSRAKWLAEAQQVFNAFIRERDRLAGHACISSGRALDWSGNNVDAGHYRSRGSAPHLRFDERNVHAQSKQDNRYGSGNAVDYRIGLIVRIGLAAVESLEADQTPAKWSIDDLAAIKAAYKLKLKQMQQNKNPDSAN